MGNNATGGKRKNKTRVFRFISQQGRTSKLEIVSRLGISLPTVLQTLKELTEDGLIWEMGEFESTGGRKAKALAAVRGVAVCHGPGHYPEPHQPGGGRSFWADSEAYPDS